MQIITLTIETSMRLGELLGLEWSRIDLKRRTAYLVDTKNGESQTVTMSSAAAGAAPPTGGARVWLGGGRQF